MWSRIAQVKVFELSHARSLLKNKYFKEKTGNFESKRASENRFKSTSICKAELVDQLLPTTVLKSSFLFMNVCVCECVCECVVCARSRVCAPTHARVTLMQVSMETRRGCQTMWSWSHRQLWATQPRCCDPNSSPLQEQYKLLATESLFQPPPRTVTELSCSFCTLHFYCGKIQGT